MPVGEEITNDRLRQIERAEEVLFESGFHAFRVRHHGDIARIEVARDERVKIWDACLADEISRKIKRLGFRYVAFELEGYRMGSMNEKNHEKQE